MGVLHPMFTVVCKCTLGHPRTPPALALKNIEIRDHIVSEKVPWDDCIVAATTVLHKAKFLVTDDPHLPYPHKKAPEFIHGDELRSGDFHPSLRVKCDR